MNPQRFLLPNPRRILVISLRYLGDVLLTTPLLTSLRNAYPNTQIDILVFQNTAGILQGNPDINQIITIPNRPTRYETVQLLRRLFRNYDLAITTQIGDRPLIYALIAAPTRIAAVPPRNAKGWWKRYLVRRWTEFDDDNTHTVLQHLKLADLLGIPRHYQLTPPSTALADPGKNLFLSAKTTNFVVLHPYPKWQYKRWTIDGWLKIGHYLRTSGFKIVLSGGPAQEEIDYISSIHSLLPSDTLNTAGKMTLAELTQVISNAKLFIGPDTGITHMAASTGVPVIAIFGPTNPVKWAPWPFKYTKDSNPFARKGSQHVNNIYLVQGEADCVPCHQEGCDRNQLSHSKCLDTLSFQRIKLTIEDIFTEQEHTGGLTK